MVFWVTAAVIAASLAVLFAATLLRTRDAGAHPAAYDLDIYRDQLREVERDLARGVIDEDGAKRLRAEIGRRVLAADAQLRNAEAGREQPRAATLMLSALIAAALVGGSLALYPLIGQPGARDLPLEARIAAAEALRGDRPSQEEAEAQLPPSPDQPAPEPRYAELMTKLRQTVAERPDDLQGQVLLARNEASLGNYKAAYEAQREVIRIKGRESTATDFTVLAELMVSAAQGYVSPEAEEALRAALGTDPTYKPALYYTGLMMIQIDRPDIAFRIWRGLLEAGPETEPWVPIIRSRIGELAWRAGVKYDPPPAGARPAPGTGAMPGPSQEDMANAAEMSPEDRQTMIRGMVERLNDRLATEGGTPQEWARLIGALGVLGETDRARAILDEARSTFAGKDEALTAIEGAARSAGIGIADTDARPTQEQQAMPGPSQEDMANAAEMSPEERQQMIRGMVERLNDRLATEGGTPQEWARLIGALGVLGETDRARAILDEARSTFAGKDEALAAIEGAARSAGIGE